MFITLQKQHVCHFYFSSVDFINDNPEIFSQAAEEAKIVAQEKATEAVKATEALDTAELAKKTEEAAALVDAQEMAAKDAVDAQSLSDALSSGEIAGIAIGALVAVIIGGAIFGIYKWKKSGKSLKDFCKEDIAGKISNKLKGEKNTDEVNLSKEELEDLNKELQPLCEQRKEKVKKLKKGGYDIDGESLIKLELFNAKPIAENDAKTLHGEIKEIEEQIDAFFAVAVLEHEMTQVKEGPKLTVEQKALLMQKVGDVLDVTDLKKEEQKTLTGRRLATLSEEEWKNFDLKKLKEKAVTLSSTRDVEETLNVEQVKEEIKKANEQKGKLTETKLSDLIDITTEAGKEEWEKKFTVSVPGQEGQTQETSLKDLANNKLIELNKEELEQATAVIPDHVKEVKVKVKKTEEKILPADAVMKDLEALQEQRKKHMGEKSARKVAGLKRKTEESIASRVKEKRKKEREKGGGGRNA